MKSSEIILSSVAAAAVAGVASAGIFDSYSVGSIDGQNGWTTRDNFTTATTVGSWDQGIKQVNDANGNRKVWRISNAVRSTTYSSMPYSFTSAQVAGETGSALWNDRGTVGSSPTAPQFGAYATTNSFYSSVSFRSATGAAQAGLGLTFSLGSKQSAVRMSYVRVQDNGSTGLDVLYGTVDTTGNFVGGSATTLATLNYTDLHTIEMGAIFNDGLANDFFGVRINGGALFAGSTWEQYYSANELITPGTPRLQAVNSLLFRVNNSTTGGTPSLTGNGFYFEDVVVNNSAIPAPGALALLGAAGLVGGRRRR
jgi:hypothetical protein